jgi:hypothetical protein
VTPLILRHDPAWQRWRTFSWATAALTIVMFFWADVPLALARSLA